MVDKTPFFQKATSCKRVQTNTGQENEKGCHLHMLKECFLAHTSPVMLISRKLTRDKWCVSDLRHINTRITKTNFGFCLIIDTFSMLGSSKLDVLSVKDAFHLLKLTEESQLSTKEVLPDIAIFWQCLLVVPKNANKYISSSMWQSVLFLDCLQSRKYCEAMYELPKIEDEPVDVDAIEANLIQIWSKMPTQQEGIIHEVYERAGKEYQHESSEVHTEIGSKKLVQRVFT